MNEPRDVKILTTEPTIAVLAEPKLLWDGVNEMAQWVASHRPECIPDDYNHNDGSPEKLFPHDLRESTPAGMRGVSDAELLVELCGRKCYDSFGVKAGRKSNAEYIENTQMGSIPHASIMYHPKFSFFVGGISRRVSHELIRNYVGADRNEEGNPSQESTRFTHHYGSFICPPRYLGHPPSMAEFTRAMHDAYEAYHAMIETEIEAYRVARAGPPKGMDRKRIYEAAAGFLPAQAETSFVWSANPVSLAKMIKERSDESADLEFQRLAKKWGRICMTRWPSLFPQPWMQVFRQQGAL